MVSCLVCVDAATNSYNLSATINDKITLPCRSTLGNTVSWFFRDSPESPLQEVYAGGAVAEQWKSHFMIGSLRSGDYNLVILSAMYNDSGLYYCLKHHENGPLILTSLTISSGLYFL